MDWVRAIIYLRDIKMKIPWVWVMFQRSSVKILQQYRAWLDYSKVLTGLTLY
jgi:hypothetical protein